MCACGSDAGVTSQEKVEMILDHDGEELGIDAVLLSMMPGSLE
jgi:hypothetical protein